MNRMFGFGKDNKTTAASGNVAADIHAAADKPTPADADEFGLADSAASWVLKKVTWANIKATLKTYFDTLYSVVAHTHSYEQADGDLTAIAGLSPANDDVIQRKSGAWTNRTPTQLVTDLTEGIEDVVGAMIGVQASGIEVVYIDFDGNLDFSLNENVIGAWITEDYALRQDGWILAVSTWSYSSVDGVTGVISVNADVTGLIGLGYKIGIVQTTQKYAIVTKVGAFSGGVTLLTCYFGTDYTLANAAITVPKYSPVKAPFGFPMDQDKWTITLSDTTNATQASPTANTWYNLGSLSFAVHIGVWRVPYELAMEVVTTLAAATNVGYRVTLSTANNSESDSGMTSVKTSAMPVITGGIDRTSFHREKLLALTSKTTYYLNGLTGSSGTSSISLRGDVIATTVKAVCAYL
ncbi:MAG: hypothetical protein M3R47_03020 [Chloroflexota bacterium]|nr:hypothetical protein [Chloroflexota bacterium]